jgi:hypothetical protein
MHKLTIEAISSENRINSSKEKKKKSIINERE